MNKSSNGLLVIEAINSRRLLEFRYDGHSRIVAPSAYGFHISTGNEVFRGYQVEGTSKSRPVPLWDLFKPHKADGMIVLERRFDPALPEYQRDDAHIKPIFAQL